LSNAFKYTDEGEVKLHATSLQAEDSENEVILVISVSDTGHGMTKEQVGKLFDEYAQFNKDANRTVEGTGLGMSITKALLNLMDGEIEVKSEPKKGSTFTVRIPQLKVGSDIVGNEMAENLRQFRTHSRSQMKRVRITREPMPYGSILIVDDAATNIYVAKGLLAPYKLQIDSAESGYAAIEKIKNGRSYDLIFMDYRMPRMDGIEAVGIIRSMGYTRPIVALTASAASGQEEFYLANGFDDFISKPIDIRHLNVTLNKFIRDRQSPEIIKAARKQAEVIKNPPEKEKPHPLVDPAIVDFFVDDVRKALPVLDAIMGKGCPPDELQTYITHMHALKSVLASAEKMELYTVARRLEDLARKENMADIQAQTGAFLTSLREIVAKLAPANEVSLVEVEAEDEDKQELRGNLILIKAASTEYNEIIIESILTELKAKAQSPSVKILLKALSRYLLHSDFDKIAEAIDVFLENY
jgi:CheY-like chemotaxis protein